MVALAPRPPTDTLRYNGVAIAFHWTLAVLIIAQIVGGIVMHKLDASEFKILLYQLHKSGGLLVLGLSLARLGWRLTHRPPALPDAVRASTPAWQHAASHATHWALYALMIGTPLLGWMMVSASERGFPTEFFYLFGVPDLPVARGLAEYELFKTLHKITAVGMLVLIGVHTAAALYHHRIKRDIVLTRMAPWVKPPAKTPDA